MISSGALPSASAGAYDVDVIVSGVPLKKYPNLDASKFFILAQPGKTYSFQLQNSSSQCAAATFEIDGSTIKGLKAVEPGRKRIKNTFDSGAVRVNPMFATPHKTLTVNPLHLQIDNSLIILQEDPQLFSFEGQSMFKIQFHSARFIKATTHKMGAPMYGLFF
jgi:hypothetical protein